VPSGSRSRPATTATRRGVGRRADGTRLRTAPACEGLSALRPSATFATISPPVPSEFAKRSVAPRAPVGQGHRSSVSAARGPGRPGPSPAGRVRRSTTTSAVPPARDRRSTSRRSRYSCSVMSPRANGCPSHLWGRSGGTGRPPRRRCAQTIRLPAAISPKPDCPYRSRTATSPERLLRETERRQAGSACSTGPLRRVRDGPTTRRPGRHGATGPSSTGGRPCRRRHPESTMAR